MARRGGEGTSVAPIAFRGVVALATVLVALAPESPAHAAAPNESLEDAPAEGKRPPTPFVTLMATSYVGDGLRFNNPYRLATPLGDDAQSVSRTAAYVDVGATALFLAPPSFQHGVALRFSAALEGVPQAVVTPSYVLERRFRHVALYGRLGAPIVLTPQKNTGLELGVGGIWFVRGGIGLSAELVGDLFYGAGTREAAKPAYPILSAQVGVVIAYEVLP